MGISIAAPVGPIGVFCIQRTLAGGKLYGLMTGLEPVSSSASYSSASFLIIGLFKGSGIWWLVLCGSAGVLRSIPQTRQMLEQAMEEVFSVAQALDIALPEDIITESMAFVDTLPPGGTASMQRDIIEGRPSEIDSWNGTVVRLGQEVGVAVPLHAFIFNSLMPLELKARGKIKFPAE